MSKRKHRRGGSRRKDFQLCAQVREALNLALASSNEEVLASAWVREVRPAPSIARLLAVVEVDEENTQGAQQALEVAKGYLRAEVAQAIHRRHTPDVVFCVVTPGQPLP
ncbi:MAG: ribosome-binding factor A [Myxococcota bacterium]